MAAVSLDRLMPAIEATYAFAQNDQYLKLVRANLGACGNELLSHLSSDDRVGMLAPVTFRMEEKSRDGCILTLEDRAIFAWWTGLLRAKNYEAILRYDEIDRVERETKKAGMVTSAVSEMRVVAGDTWFVQFPNVYGEKPAVPMLVAGMLDGSVKPKYADDDSDAGN